MLFVNFLFPAALLAVAALALALPSQSQSQTMELPKGYSIFVPEWEVQAKPGGDTMILRGTVEEVLDELHGINPNYEHDFGLDLDLDLDFDLSQPTFPSLSQPAAPAVEKRDDFQDARFQCNVTVLADARVIATGAKYLGGVKGQPRGDPGPNSCGRVSCSWNSAIWFCNDNTHSISAGSYQTLADGTYHILKQCTAGEWVSGQTWHKDNWRVLVGRDKC
ncbi:hypothetical protein CTA2_5845 [Colletotrichum tanaceti]|uniref:Secreted protein n=1 Tax=Colletotrichum tanaceti TaxID=1306861 RepID=A0A4U6X866_9PEZI|nr:hypothetical protein CTA2_5845 [Colletotrichum tanaceti]TKW49717.1 hypothetical protein CTA1_13088 [Colletotrichum tanaceti]